MRLRIAQAPDGYVDPMGWGRTYIGAILSMGHPDGTVVGAAQYGYFEARMAFPAGKTVWGAAWLLSQDGLGSNHLINGTGEIDINETYGVGPDGPLYTHNCIHDWSPDGTSDLEHLDHMTKLSDFGIYADTSQTFHVYGCRVTPTDVIYYIDNVEVWRTATIPSVSGNMYMLINTGLSPAWPIDLARYSEGADTYVDYIRIYQ